jgi:predicted metal-binding membrane protein
VPSLVNPDGRPTPIETALQHRGAVLVVLVAIPAAAWTWIALMARDMYGTMHGASAWMMSTAWDFPRIVLLWTMWAVMMTAMMLPTAAPLILLYAAALRLKTPTAAPGRIYALTAGYVVVWALFSAGATALQRALSGPRPDADDRTGDTAGRRNRSRNCWRIPDDAAQTRMPARLSVAARLHDVALA